MQGELFKGTHGGKRKGAGRKPKKCGASERHKTREVVTPRTPVHVTLRVGKEVPYLRTRSMWRAIAKATIAAAKAGIRIVHASLQHNHCHLICEASDQYALAKGMRAFEASAVHWINLSAKRTGSVFPDRYHVHVLRTPTEAHRAIRYCLCNWRKHGEQASCQWPIDAYSTGYAFWNAEPPSGYEPLPSARSESWMLQEGWRKVGEISPYDVPGGAR